MYTVLTDILEKTLRCTQKTVFIRNDKSKITMEQKWIKVKQNMYWKIDRSMKPQSSTYRKVQNDLIENINSNRLVSKF